METLNRADTLIFEVEKQLREIGDKLSAEDKAAIENEVSEFKKVRETNDVEKIKNAIDAFTQKVYAIFGKAAQQAGGDANGAQQNWNGNGSSNSDGAQDADYDVH